MDLISTYQRCKETRLSGRYICLQHILPVMDQLPPNFKIRTIGFSEKGNPIQGIWVGSGDHKILAWSQMHGNESTTTKGVFDFLNLIAQNDRFKNNIEHFLIHNTLLVIPILNPDGAAQYTRHNANDFDLNRDAKNRSQQEMKVFMEIASEFKPDLCLNLHDQRSIYGVGDTSAPATMSFLSPSANPERTLTPSRIHAMNEIGRINRFLQTLCPGGIGRYDDSFNENCVGDYFQSQGIPTLLFEAGHYPDDYQREHARSLVFYALCVLFRISPDSSDIVDVDEYNAIPENNNNLRDLILRNASVGGNLQDIAIQYQERLNHGMIYFEPHIDASGDLPHLFGHREIDIENNEILINSHENVFDGEKIAMILYKSSQKPINI